VKIEGNKTSLNTSQYWKAARPKICRFGHLWSTLFYLIWYPQIIHNTTYGVLFI